MGTVNRMMTAALMGGLCLAPCAFAGPITPPPGPVVGTHKTLTEIEPRTAINATNTPGDSDSTPSVFKITEPGSYYLTGNVTVASGRSGIEIDASNVTVDLMGFRLLGQLGSEHGILVQGTETNVTIRNGSVRSFGGDGLSGLNGDAMRVSDFTAVNCNGRGVAVGQGSVLINIVADSNIGTGITALTEATIVSCTSRDNQQSGFRVDGDGTITGCTAVGNVGDGIEAGAYSTIHACSASDNGQDGISASNATTITGCTAASNGGDGFELVGGGSLVAECAAKGNQDNGIQCQTGELVSNCVVSLSGNDGIVAGSGSIVEGCVVDSSGGDGIVVGNDCTIRGNVCDGNGVDGLSAGIRVSSGDNVIDGNQCTDNDYGLEVVAAGNLIIRNFCAGNTTLNWSLVANNKCLVVSAANAGAISGNSGGVSPGSTNPWANFTY